jgi:L-lactate dehydrogenase complex protein LldE
LTQREEQEQVRSESVALFATCLVDLFRPRVGFATATLLENAGYNVSVPRQGCCGQPNFNGGDMRGARALARATIAALSVYDYVVVPSCSCAAMIRIHYPELFAHEPEMMPAARELAGKTWELTTFLVEVAGCEDFGAEFASDVAVHDSCSGLRELGVREQPRRLLGRVKGLTEKPLANPDVCCGFGGLFCVKYPDISTRIADKKLADIHAVGAAALISTDLGCLMHLAGRLHREGETMPALHVAEVLTGMTEDAD